MKVYEAKGFINPARVRIALGEKKAIAQVEFIEVNVMQGEHRQPEFVAKNPSASIPVLELDDGTCIAECSAITEYIDHTFPGISLTGETAKERAVIHMMQRRAEQNLLDAVGTYFHHGTPGLGKDLETYQNKEWGEKQKDKAIAGMYYFDRVLESQDYVAGNNFSLADITVYMGLAFADFAKVQIPAECQHLAAWRAKVAQRPSVVALK
ncbi:MAG: glutathione S-transferase [Cyanobacteria bacterium J06621_12]